MWKPQLSREGEGYGPLVKIFLNKNIRYGIKMGGFFLSFPFISERSHKYPDPFKELNVWKSGYVICGVWI